MALYYWCSGQFLDVKGRPLCLEHHFHPAWRTFWSHNELTDALFSLLCYYQEGGMFFLLSGGQKAFLLKRSVWVNKPPLKRDCSQIGWNYLLDSLAELGFSKTMNGATIWTPTLPSMKWMSHESESLRTAYKQIAPILFWERLEGEALLPLPLTLLFSRSSFSHVVSVPEFPHLQSTCSPSQQEQDVFLSSASKGLWVGSSGCSAKDYKLACACEEAGAGHGAWLSLLLIADIELMLFLAWGRAITQEFLLKWFFVKPPLTPTRSPSRLSLPSLSEPSSSELQYWGHYFTAGLRLLWSCR